MMMDDIDALSTAVNIGGCTIIKNTKNPAVAGKSGKQPVNVINVRDASEEVFAIPEIMANIYQFLDRKKDLLSCALHERQ